MKNITLFIMESCPYCQKAIKTQNQLLKHERYKDLKIEVIDETVHPDIARKHDYFYVPTYYVDGAKKHEGAADENDIRAVLESAIAL